MFRKVCPVNFEVSNAFIYLRWILRPSQHYYGHVELVSLPKYTFTEQV